MGTEKIISYGVYFLLALLFLSMMVGGYRYKKSIGDRQTDCAIFCYGGQYDYNGGRSSDKCYCPDENGVLQLRKMYP